MGFLIGLIVVVVAGGFIISGIAFFAALMTADTSGKGHAKWLAEHGETALSEVFTGDHNVTFMENPGLTKKLHLKDLIAGANERGYELVSSTPGALSTVTHVFRRVTP